MRKFMPLLLFVIVLSQGCAWQGALTDSAGHQLTAYSFGRASYGPLTDLLQTATIERMEDRYNQFLAANANVVVVEPSQSIVFMNDLARIMSVDTDDPYGLLGDLTYILQTFGAEIIDGQMVSVQPVPLSLYRAYSDGWKQTKWIKSK